MRSLIYFIKEAFKGIARHLSTSIGSIITIFLSLLIIGAFVLGGTIINNVVASVENEVTLKVYIADDTPDASISMLEDYIKSLDYVSEVSFTTKDQALQRFTSSDSMSPSIMAQLDGENPLPASIDVELSDPQQVELVADQIMQNGTFLAICDNPDNPSESLIYGKKTVEKLFQLANYLRFGSIVVIILMIFIALVFINNTIRLAILARQKEIAIMRLVGASNGFIRGPFLVEGAIHAIIGAALAVICLELLRRYVMPMVAQGLSFLPLGIAPEVFVYVYIFLFVAGLIIGLIGSAFAMRRYLKV